MRDSPTVEMVAEEEGPWDPRRGLPAAGTARPALPDSDVASLQNPTRAYASG